MRAALFACAALLAAGMAFAQDAPEPTPTDAAPNNGPHVHMAHEFGRVYPERALTQGALGVVHLCCEVRTDRQLECQVATEWPHDRGFAGSAMRMVRAFRFDDDAPLPTAPIQVPIEFQISPMTPEASTAFESAVHRIRDASNDLCGPGTGPAPDYIVVTATLMTSPNGRTRGSTRGFDRDIPGSLPQSSEN